MQENGTASVGSSADIPRADHVHPSDSTKADNTLATTSADGLMSSTDKTKLDGAAELSGATFTGLVAYDDTVFTTNIDCSLGNSFSITVTADFTQTFSNVPATGNACVIVLKLADAGSYVITWDASIKWANGTTPTLTAIGTDSVVLYTIDGGLIWHGNANIGYA